MSNLVTFKKFREVTGLSRTQTYRYFESGRLTPLRAGAKLILIDLHEWNKNFALTPAIGSEKFAAELKAEAKRAVAGTNRKATSPVKESNKVKKSARGARSNA
jgi:hypothetical protein